MLSNNFWQDWVADAETKQAEYDAIAKTLPALTLVRKYAKGTHGRTPDIRLICQRHFTGLSVALRVHESKVLIDYRGPAELMEQVRESDDEPYLGYASIAVKGLEDVAPVTITCARCGTAASHNAVWILKEALRSLAGMSAGKKTRPESIWTRT